MRLMILTCTVCLIAILTLQAGSAVAKSQKDSRMVLHDVVSRISLRQQTPQARNVFPSAPSEESRKMEPWEYTIRVSYESGTSSDWDAQVWSSTVDDYWNIFDASAESQWEIGGEGYWQSPKPANPRIYRYSLYAVPREREQAVKRLLVSVEMSPLYGLFSRRFSTAGRLYWCRFARRVSFPTGIGTGHYIQWPREIQDRFANEPVRALWLEFYIPTDSRGIPRGQPEAFARIIALQTDAALYLVQQREEWGRWNEYGGGEFEGYSGHVFDVTSLKSKAALTRVFDAYRHALVQRFGHSSLGATENKTWKGLSHHIQLVRDHKRCELLSDWSKAPRHELTTYEIEWWVREEGDEGSKLQRFICAHATNYVLLSVGKGGPYKEPTPQEKAFFREAVQKAMDDAQRDVCKALNGRAAGDVCVLGGG